ncbi:MAG: zonular occludens toxin domain-containing protein [Candidatus Aenigmatarchaeota archaeon]
MKYLLNYIEKNIIKRIEKDYDYLHVNVGYEGSGKSTLSIIQAIAYLLARGYVIDIKDEIIYNEETKHNITFKDFVNKHIIFTKKEFLKSIKNLTSKSPVIVDEGISVFYTADTLTEELKEVIKTLTQIRMKNYFIIVNASNFFYLHQDIRYRRALSVCHIKKRGLFAFYDQKKINKIKRNDEGLIYFDTLPNFFDTFDNSLIPMSLWNYYLKRKNDYMFEKFETNEKVIDILENNYTLKDLSDYYQINYHIIRKKVLELLKNEKINKKDIIRYNKKIYLTEKVKKELEKMLLKNTY